MKDESGDRTDLHVSLGPLRLPNPVMNASGTGGYGTEELPFLIPEALGAFVTKGLSLEPRAGNSPPRIVETPSGMLNAIGLENIGLQAFLGEHLPRLRDRGVRVVVNLFGETEEEYLRGASLLSRRKGIHGLEINVSCPNVKKGGRAFGRDPEVLHRLVKGIRACSELALLVKLPPDEADLMEAAQAAWEGGCNGLTVANTYRGLAVDVHHRTPKLGIGPGGLSGPAIRPLTLYRVWMLAGVSPVPIIGVGGIASVNDALEYLIAGAAAVQVGTGFFHNPRLFQELLEGIASYLKEKGLESVSQIQGTLRGMPPPPCFVKERGKREKK
jgi:dihydroorotate dehydrogenase (NAD+) catalytic subunit